MKKKILMLFMCISLSTVMLSACENTGADSGETLTPPQIEEVTEETIDAQAGGEEEKGTEETPEAEPVSDEEDVSDAAPAMPRSDAYDMFLAGEMDVTVINESEDDYACPKSGTYSYEELRDAVAQGLTYGNGGKLAVKYALFTPDSGEEGDDILALYVENSDPSFMNWIGFIGYNNGKLEMSYSEEFGYRSYFDLYYNGDILCGGSGGAGAHYQDYMTVQADASVKTEYKSAYLYSTWGSDAFYMVDPDYEYADIPELDGSSALEMTVVKKDDKVYIYVSKWSDNKAIKEQEENYIKALEDLGAVVLNETDINLLMRNTVDENKTMTWNDIETFDAPETIIP